MSHITDCKLRVRDLADLKQAVEAVGLEWREGQQTFAWWGVFVGDSNDHGGRDPKTFGQCLHAIGLPGEPGVTGRAGPWEIGVVPAQDGDGFNLLYDNYGNAGEKLERLAGRNLSRLKQEYSVAVATKKSAQLARAGFALRRENVGARVRLRWVKR